MNSEVELRQINTVTVMKNGERAGTLCRTSHGAEFIYDEAFRSRCLATGSFGIACTLSPHTATHSITGINVHPFFAGLLPEGLRLKALRNSLKTSEDDLFTMLVALGEESIGDVYVVSEVAPPQVLSKPVSLEQADFITLLEESINPPLKRGAVDIGVPGVMPKLSASMITFPIRIKERRKEYILKLQPKEYPNLIENEAFFMAMAKACGLLTAEVKIVTDAKGQKGLLVTRFDRVYDKETKKFHRLHQEDACQLIGAYPHDKYRLSAQKICDALAKYSAAPIIDLKKFIDLYIFSYIIGNGDLHAKNVSLRARGEPALLALSPCYDIVSTLPYGDKGMAVPLRGRDDNFTKSDFSSFAAQYSIPPKAIETSIAKMIHTALPWLDRLPEIGFEAKTEVFLKETIQERIDRLS
jgi:serine/threonine-protein kinase HipA